MTSSKRILYIQKPPGGGSLIALYEMVKILDKQKYEPIIFCYEHNTYTSILEQLQAKVIYHTRANSKAISGKSASVSKLRKSLKSIRKIKSFLIDDFKMADVIAQVIINNKIDLIHHNCDFPFIRQGLLANRKLKLPQVCHYRSLQPYKKFSLDWFIDNKLIKKVDQHIFISNAVKDHFLKYLDISTGNSIVLRDIIDVEKFKHAKPATTALRELDIHEGDVVISCIGRVLEWKGQHVFIEAFAKVSAQFSNAKAFVVGPYEKGVGDYDYFLRLKKLVADFKLEGKVFFTGNRNDIHQILSLSDCIVHSSVTAEPQGLIIVEALFTGTPIVVTNSGGAAELIINNEGGLKVPPGDANAMAEAIIEIISGKLPKLQGDEKPRILSEFVPSEQIEVIESIYERLCAQVYN